MRFISRFLVIRGAIIVSGLGYFFWQIHRDSYEVTSTLRAVRPVSDVPPHTNGDWHNAPSLDSGYSISIMKFCTMPVLSHPIFFIRESKGSSSGVAHRINNWLGCIVSVLGFLTVRRHSRRLHSTKAAGHFAEIALGIAGGCWSLPGEQVPIPIGTYLSLYAPTPSQNATTNPFYLYWFFISTLQLISRSL